MNKKSFTIDSFNVLQDDENYYVFRALNNADHKDIITGASTDEAGLVRVRTNRERFEEENGNAKYNVKSEISLEEVYDHVKIRHLKETNCISLSTNANVSIDYGQGYNEEYVMVRVPKQKAKNVYNAGEYMLAEVERKLNEAMKEVPPDSEILKLIDRIESETNYRNIKLIVSDVYRGIRKVQGRFERKGEKANPSFSISSRLDKKQYFTDEQQLEYSKIIAKLTVLEMSGVLRSALPTKADNSSLIATIGLAFSSGELIHYKDIEKSEMTTVSKELMDLFSLVQQLKEKDVDQSEVSTLEQRIIELTVGGYKFSRENGRIVLNNEKDTIDIREDNGEDITEKNQETNLNIEDVYKITKGRISYEKAKIAIEFVTNLVNSRRKAIQYSAVIKKLVGDDSSLAQKVQEECYVIDRKIISRENNMGMKIAASVNIGLTREERQFISNAEQVELIRKIQELNEDKLEEFRETNGVNIENDVLENLLEKRDEISENQFFAEAIVDGIDLEKIYKTTLEQQRNMTKEEREKLVNALKSADCKRLYNAFANAGISHNNISGYIINLLMDNGYKGYTLEELSKLENLDEIIVSNIRNLNCRIQPLRLDKVIGIEDDSYLVSDTEIRLREYQQIAFQNIMNIFEEKNFASMVLPTGAGKSFVAMSVMMQYKNSNIIFIAPQNTILLQFQTHIIKNVLKRDDVEIKDYAKVIEEVFPHLKMFCYDTISERDEEWLKSHNADLIILDELHRAGAKTWQPQIKSLLDNNPSAKTLGMTATPVRDVDHKDMARELAEMSGSYTKEELTQKKYLASEMYLLDAMQDQIVVSPKVVTFDYTLGESEEYKELKRMIETEKDAEKKEQLRQVYKEMTRIIKESEKEGINGILAENIKKKDGRYIVFIPYNKDSNLSAEEYMKQEIEKVIEYFKDIDSNPEVAYLLSNRGDKKENLKALKEFEASKSKHLKLLFAIDMLNEGVHVDNIDGAIMLRPISENSKILYLQQMGRCIFSQDPNNPVKDEDRPIVFDVYNNYLAQRLDREVNKTNQTSDLQRLQGVVNWIDRHKGYIPDINSEDIKEARRAVTLKKIQQKYQAYLVKERKNKNLTESELYEIQRIIEIGRSIDLWDMDFPERIIPPGEKDIIRNDTFKVTGTQREFLDLFKKAKDIKRGIQSKNGEDAGKEETLSNSIRIKSVIEVLDVLTEYGVEINNATIDKECRLQKALREVSFYTKTAILEELEELGVDLNYRLGEEYEFVKKAFYSGERAFFQYDIKDLRKYGVFESFSDSKKCAVKEDFVIHGPKKIIGMHIMTGTRYDEEGYDWKGVDENGFHRGSNMNGYGFYRSGIHSKTNEIYNPRGFKVDLTYRETGDKYDDLGFDINEKHKNTGRRINEYGFDYRGHYLEEPSKGSGLKDLGIFDRNGFDIYGRNKYTATNLDEENYDRDGYYYELQKDGSYKKTDKKRSEVWGKKKIPSIDKYGFDRWGTHNITKTNYDENGFDVYGIHKATLTRVDENGKTRDGYRLINNENRTEVKVQMRKLSDGTEIYFDQKGTYMQRQEDGTYVATEKKTDPEGYNVYGLNERNFSRKGIYWEKQKDGTYKSTGKTRDPEGYDKNGLDEYNFDREGMYWEKQEDGTYKETGNTRDPQGFNSKGLNEYNFDRKGMYWKKQEDGTYKPTGKDRDPEGYDCNGLDQFDFKRGSDISIHGFDRQGYYYEEQEDGEYISTGLKHNKYGFRMDKRHIITGTAIDYRHFDIYGKCKANKNNIYDENGFKQDGTYLETGEKYHNGYNAYGVDKDGKDKKGKVAYEVSFAKEYTTAFLSVDNEMAKRVIGKYVPRRRMEKEEEYRKRTEAYTKKTLYLAEQKCPKIKNVIIINIAFLQREIRKREEKIEQLSEQKITNKAQIETLKQENAALREKIDIITHMQGIDK